METDRTRCVGEAMDQGYTFLRLMSACGWIVPPPPSPQRREECRQAVREDLAKGELTRHPQADQPISRNCAFGGETTTSDVDERLP